MIKYQGSTSAPLAGEVDSRLPSGLSLGAGSLPIACVSPGLFDQIVFEDQMGSDRFFLTEECLVQQECGDVH